MHSFRHFSVSLLVMLLTVGGLLPGRLSVGPVYGDDDKTRNTIFSGPQPGEKLPPLKVKEVYGKEAGKTFDYVQLADGKPTLLIFMHKLTRPSAAVTRTLLTFCGKHKPEKMFCAMIYLPEDLTEGEKRLQRAQHVFKPRNYERVGISPDCREGPGAYGLNRNVTLTILVAHQGKVTANFALVQPSVQADVMKVIAAVVALTGDRMPRPEELIRNRTGQKKPGRITTDPQLASLLRAVIQKDASAEQVDKAAQQVENYVGKHPARQSQLVRIAGIIVERKYGTKHAQERARRWIRQYGNSRTREKSLPQKQPRGKQP